MEKKYKILKGDSIVCLTRRRHKLYRIKALCDFGNVKKGYLGGYIETEDNLSQEGNCWVDKDAKVFEDARIFGNAEVFGDACVYGNAKVFGNACWVYDYAKVYGNAEVYGDVEEGIVRVFGISEVYKNTTTE